MRSIVLYRMDITKKLIGSCSFLDLSRDETIVDYDLLLWRLLLFETFILKSIRLKEIRPFTKIFGYSGTTELLSSDALKIQCDATMVGETGRNSLLQSRKRKGILPVGSFSFNLITPHSRKEYINQCLSDLDSIPELSMKQIKDLKDIVLKNLIARPDNYGFDTLSQLKNDLIYNENILKVLVKRVLYSVRRLIIHPERFNLKIVQIDNEDFRSESDLGRILNLSPAEVHETIQKAILGLSSINNRIEDMSTYSAISESVDEDLELFQKRFSLLASSISPKQKVANFQRILTIGGLPQFSSAADGTNIDIGKLLKIRQSSECREFRDWLSGISEFNDHDLKEYLSGVKAKLGSLISSPTGKAISFLANIGVDGIGGPIAGIPMGVLSKFVLEKIFPKRGPMLFITRLYPSIFIHET